MRSLSTEEYIALKKKGLLEVTLPSYYGIEVGFWYDDENKYYMDFGDWMIFLIEISKEYYEASVNYFGSDLWKKENDWS